MVSSSFFAIGRLALPAVLLLQLVSATTLPIVDLGYEKHQAIEYDSTYDFYNFSNIRYAAPPTGNLRFRAPQDPATDRSTVKTGSVGRICPQAFPYWAVEGQTFQAYYSQGIPFDPSTFVMPNLTVGEPDPRTSEDCLFLDVVVPKAAYTNGRAPVIVWIHGGGYTQGSKVDSGNPSGLIARSKSFTANGVIYVSINYRLGAFGWSSGSTLAKDGTPNAGLYDQRFALEWVQKYISRFGGDPKKVTVLGESAGGASVMQQITAYGGSNGPTPFHRAIAQSPALWPTPSTTVQESVFQSLLTQAGVTSLAELRALSTSDLQTANALQIGLHSAYGTFTYGPVVDGVFSPDLPTHLLTAGKFSKNVEVMVGHNSDEGPLFTDPAVDDSASYKEYLAGMFPTMPAATLSTIDSTVYPADFSGAQPYTSHLERAILTASESLITCNTYALDIAFKLCTSAYVFDVLPGVHAQDIPYTYYVGDGSDTAVSNTTVAYALQDYITSFAVDGHPRSVVKGVPAIPLYGASAKSVNLGEGGIMVGKAPSANSRCTWWQTAAFK